MSDNPNVRTFARSRRTFFIESAKIIRQLLPRERRYQACQCIREIFLPDPETALEQLERAVAAVEAGAEPDDPRNPPGSEAEFFELVFGDPTGAEYWRLWLPNGESDDAIASLLATHHFAQDAKPRNPNFQPTPPLPLSRELAELHVKPFIWGRAAGYRNRHEECLDALKLYSAGNFQDRIEAIARDEELEHLIPPSLRDFLAQSEANCVSEQTLQDAPPAVQVEPDRTGAPGRPSSMHLVLPEAERRRSQGETHARVKDEAAALLEWFEKTHPGLPALTEKTIRNKIASDHRNWTASARN